jgi:hypothetical protein
MFTNDHGQYGEEGFTNADHIVPWSSNSWGQGSSVVMLPYGTANSRSLPALV